MSRYWCLFNPRTRKTTPGNLISRENRRLHNHITEPHQGRNCKLSPLATWEHLSIGQIDVENDTTRAYMESGPCLRLWLLSHEWRLFYWKNKKNSQNSVIFAFRVKTRMVFEKILVFKDTYWVSLIQYVWKSWFTCILNLQRNVQQLRPHVHKNSSGGFRNKVFF